MPLTEREQLVERWWHPHRDQLVALIETRGNRPVLHLSVHSFTPIWGEVVREVDVGVLYDPSRKRERQFADEFIDELGQRDPSLRIRRNQPYRGTADGLTTAFRKRFRPTRYLGVELEVSQRFPNGEPDAWRRLRDDICRALKTIIDGH